MAQASAGHPTRSWPSNTGRTGEPDSTDSTKLRVIRKVIEFTDAQSRADNEPFANTRFQTSGTRSLENRDRLGMDLSERSSKRGRNPVEDRCFFFKNSHPTRVTPFSHSSGGCFPG